MMLLCLDAAAAAALLTIVCAMHTSAELSVCRHISKLEPFTSSSASWSGIRAWQLHSSTRLPLTDSLQPAAAQAEEEEDRAQL